MILLRIILLHIPPCKCTFIHTHTRNHQFTPYLGPSVHRSLAPIFLLAPLPPMCCFVPTPAFDCFPVFSYLSSNVNAPFHLSRVLLLALLLSNRICCICLPVSIGTVCSLDIENVVWVWPIQSLENQSLSPSAVHHLSPFLLYTIY